MNELRPRGHTRFGAARHGRLRGRGPWALIGKIVASVVAVVLISTVSVGAYAAWDLVHSAKKSVHLVGEPKQPIPDIGAIKGGVNILMAATDTRTGQASEFGPLSGSSGAGNNDVTMLLHLSQDHTHMTVVSFPRDLMVPIPKCPNGNGGSTPAQDQAMFNTTLAEGGLPCIVLTVEAMTGLQIPFAGLITFDGVVAMSNAVGGVPVCIDNGIDDPYTGLNLSPGTHVIQGAEAAQFLRTRHGVGDGSDLGRISNQQLFLSALARTIKSAGTLTNPAKVWALAKATVQNVQLSDSLDNITTLYQIAIALKDINLNNVLFVQYPVYDDPANPNRVLPSDDADTLIAALKNDQPLQLTGGTGDGTNTVQPSAAPTPAPTSTGVAPGSSGTGSASGTPAPSDTSAPVQLPSNVTGQTAATQTCSNGNGPSN